MAEQKHPKELHLLRKGLCLATTRLGKDLDPSLVRFDSARRSSSYFPERTLLSRAQARTMRRRAFSSGTRCFKIIIVCKFKRVTVPLCVGIKIKQKCIESYVEFRNKILLRYLAL
jgi:hypothetical protein